jgi:uncharacterized membrane protein HdeD (DUF308 family)
MPDLEVLRDPGEAETSRGWWLFVVIGLLSVIAGGILVAKPGNSLATLAVIFGIFLLLDGIVDLVTSFGRDENRALAAIFGIVAIVIGILLIRHPTHAVNAIGLLIGIWLVVAGVLRLLRAFTMGFHPLRLVIALLEIAVGVIIVAQPHIGYSTLAIIIGIWLIINGLAMIGLGFVAKASD